MVAAWRHACVTALLSEATFVTTQGGFTTTVGNLGHAA